MYLNTNTNIFGKYSNTNTNTLYKLNMIKKFGLVWFNIHYSAYSAAKAM